MLSRNRGRRWHRAASGIGAAMVLSAACLSAAAPAPAASTNATGTAASPSTGPPLVVAATVTSGQALIYALENAGPFNKVAAVLQSQMDMADTVLSAAGAKLFLAPTDEAMAQLPKWVASSPELLKATIMQHILNGSFPLDEVPQAPAHAVGHSLLNNPTYANLPGGNGLPVALSRQADGTIYVAEAMDDCLIDGSPSNFYDITIAPLSRVMTVPGNTSFTLGFIGDNAALASNLARYGGQAAAELDALRGVTVFAPTNAAFARHASTMNAMSDAEKAAVLGQHVIAGRTVYSPLLQTQGALITTSGQDMIFNAGDMTITVGNATAKIVQTDIITANGVLHRIDDVLIDTTVDMARAGQAIQSALAWQNGPVNGFVSGTNAGSSQGMDVPPAQDGSSRNRNATVQGNGGLLQETGPAAPAAAAADTASNTTAASGLQGAKASSATTAAASILAATAGSIAALCMLGL